MPICCSIPKNVKSVPRQSLMKYVMYVKKKTFWSTEISQCLIDHCCLIYCYWIQFLLLFATPAVDLCCFWCCVFVCLRKLCLMSAAIQGCCENLALWPPTIRASPTPYVCTYRSTVFKKNEEMKWLMGLGTWDLVHHFCLIHFWRYCFYQSDFHSNFIQKCVYKYGLQEN